MKDPVKWLPPIQGLICPVPLLKGSPCFISLMSLSFLIIDKQIGIYIFFIFFIFYYFYFIIFLMLFLSAYIVFFIYVCMYGSVGSSFLCEGFL